MNLLILKFPIFFTFFWILKLFFSAAGVKSIIFGSRDQASKMTLFGSCDKKILMSFVTEFIRIN